MSEPFQYFGEKPSVWDEKNSKLTVSCRVFDVLEKTFENKNDKRKGDFFVINSNDWVLSVAITKENKFLLVNQFRFGTKDFSWEPAGGILEKNEDIVEGAKRELLEETGFAGNNAKLIGQIYPNPAILSNTAHIVLIENCEKIAQTSFDENEEIQVGLFTLEQIEDMILNGQIKHSVALNAIYIAKLYLEKNKNKNKCNKS